MKAQRSTPWRWSALLLLATFSLPSAAQILTATLGGRVSDPSGAVLPNTTVTAMNSATGFSRSAQTSEAGEYTLLALPVGEYTVTVESAGFRRQTKSVSLLVGQAASLDFSLTLGQFSDTMVVQATSEITEPTRTQVSSVITENQIDHLPVNGREFIDFALLSPAVQIGETTSGSSDVIVEPVTKLSFAGQNIHYNFIAVDGADNVSTASGIQRATPPQDSVREFRVINTDYSAEFGRAVGGIVNIITRSGTNNWHGSLYEYFQNNAVDASNILQAPGLHTLRQNQFGASIGGPIRRDKTFIFANYEGQRRAESPFYNSAVLQNIGPADGPLPCGDPMQCATINYVKINVFHLPAEPAGLNVLRAGDIDNGFIRMDRNFGKTHFLFARYFITDGRLTNQSPLNSGFELPSAFRNNFFRDQSAAADLTSTFSGRMINELRGQFARRSFGYPPVTTQPHLEVSNTFNTGVTRGGPDFYREQRIELVDNFTNTRQKHTLVFGGNFNWVRTTESFPVFYPFSADFASLRAFLGTDGAMVMINCGAPTCPHPFALSFERFNSAVGPGGYPFAEPTLDTSVYAGSQFSAKIDKQAAGTFDHTYDAVFIQDRWRAANRLTLNGGFRWEFETWPSVALNNPYKNFDPRVGLAYNLGVRRNFVVRAGFGLFHGIIPAALLVCQEISCGGFQGPFPGRMNEDALNAKAGLFAFASKPAIMNAALSSLLLTGTYPDAAPAPSCPNGKLSSCGFFGAATLVRFSKDYQNPYGIHSSLSVEFEPLKDTAVELTYLHVRGVHLGSVFNVNQPPPSGQVLVHDSGGTASLKNVYYANWTALAFCPQVQCNSYPVPVQGGQLRPGVSPLNFPLDPASGRALPYALYFEADSRWNSMFDGLLVNISKRLTQHFSYGVSYTYSKTIDDGPNPSFVLVPQDSRNIRAQKAVSSDDVRHRFVANATLAGPTRTNILLRDFQFGLVVTLQSPQFFTKYAGFDANGDVFGTNDRVGIEGRNTFVGDTLKTVDLRLERIFSVGEKGKFFFFAEAFNLLNSVNIRFFNTAYGAADFCPEGGDNAGCNSKASFFQGSPNPLYGTPRSVFNPRQLQFGLRFSF